MSFHLIDYPVPCGYQVRKCSVEDIPALSIIEKACFSVPWSDRAFEDSFTGNLACFFGVFGKDGKPIGYAGIYFLPDGAEITNIATMPAFRRKGIASALLQTLIAEAENREKTEIRLEVRASNEAAAGLYRKYGFREYGIRKSYYRAPSEDAILMVRKLGGLSDQTKKEKDVAKC